MDVDCQILWTVHDGTGYTININNIIFVTFFKIIIQKLSQVEKKTSKNIESRIEMIKNMD